MSTHTSRLRWLHVAAAAAVILVLAGLLGVRIVDWARASAPAAKVPVPPAATVPAPHAVVVEGLTVPCWACPESQEWPLRFRTDLDLLAPLGTGAANAAVWFKDFAKPSGSRWKEAKAAMERRVKGAGDVGDVLPPDDPLLLEAEPWCDQATMRFYPDIYPMKGWESQIPNLMLQLTFARSWVARGMTASEPAKAMDDFRRVIRMGRLLRQEDVTIIADLVGLACIRIGTQGIYDLAIKRGDAQTALVAAVVLGEAAPQRLVGTQRLTKTDISPYMRKDPAGFPALELPEARLNDIVTVATGGPDRRFRAEAILELGLVRALGTPAQQGKAVSVLNQLASGSDQILAEAAVWSRDTKLTKEYLRDAPALTLLPPPAPPSKPR
jgi:hypothetical protein